MALSSFFQHSFLFCSILGLSLALISVWIKKSPWIWGGFLIISLLLAYTTNTISSTAFIPLVLLTLLLIGFHAFSLSGLFRFILFSTSLITSGGLFYNLLPGFSPPLKAASTPINYGEVVAGILFLGLYVRTLNNKSDWKLFLKTACPIALLGALLLLGFQFYMHATEFFSTSFSPLHFFLFFLFQTIPEEAFFRGFVQKEICQWVHPGWKGDFFGVVLSSLLFCLFNLTWIDNPFMLGVIFVSGLIYGFVYQITKMIEASILSRCITACFYFCLAF